jgi:hypothetical protein
MNEQVTQRISTLFKDYELQGDTEQHQRFCKYKMAKKESSSNSLKFNMTADDIKEACAHEEYE